MSLPKLPNSVPTAQWNQHQDFLWPGSRCTASGAHLKRMDSHGWNSWLTKKISYLHSVVDWWVNELFWKPIVDGFPDSQRLVFTTTHQRGANAFEKIWSGPADPPAKVMYSGSGLVKEQAWWWSSVFSWRSKWSISSTRGLDMLVSCSFVRLTVMSSP